MAKPRTLANTVTAQTISGNTTATIARDGSNIMSLAEDMTIDQTSAGFTLEYADATRGWVLI